MARPEPSCKARPGTLAPLADGWEITLMNFHKPGINYLLFTFNGFAFTKPFSGPIKAYCD